MTTEEKAKAYDEVLAKLKRYEGSPTLWNYRGRFRPFIYTLGTTKSIIAYDRTGEISKRICRTLHTKQIYFPYGNSD